MPASELLQDHITSAWMHAVRALNCAENEGLKDTSADLTMIVARLSQAVEFHVGTEDDAVLFPKSRQHQADAGLSEILAEWNAAAGDRAPAQVTEGTTTAGGLKQPVAGSPRPPAPGGSG